ncbi:LytR family transcriptional regulator [Cytobacillus depressus]|uniref:LytR family transcriptional regulator n=1 Tax=Cytobacillus depressus TaxID=1602942 RepID=A0A6L3V5Y4_9BACI|nr:LCP family protein [Cytobacillus depressus]KAB2336646.1 LytR family transcriptional regulator [Cytobacillus depressus]
MLKRRHRRSIDKKKRKKQIALLILLPILVLGLATAAWGTHYYNQFKKSMVNSYEEIEGRDLSSKREEVVEIENDHFSMLVIGVDDSEERGFGEQSRSDVLIMATVNQNDHSAKMLSIPRDSYVYIPEAGHKTRINHAHAYGGPKATIDVVESLLNIPVDYYVRVNFTAFLEVIDALGGIEVDVPFAFSEQNSQDRAGAIRLQPGLQTLNGEEALAFARTRPDNDIERGKRQQEVIKAIIQKTMSLKSISKLDDVFKAVGSNMKTDLAFDEIKYLGEFGIKKRISIDSLTLAGSDYYVNRAYYYQLDEKALDDIKIELQNHLEMNQQQTN